MTVSNSTYRVSYNGNGSTTSFSIPFYFINNSDLLVTKLDTNVTPNVETTLVLGTDYNLSGAGDLAGGSLTTIGSISPLASGETITVERNIPYTQSTDYEPFGRFPAETLEENVDRLTMLVQQVKGLTDRTPLFEKTTNYLNRTMEEPESGKVLSWDASGNIVNLTGSINTSTYTYPDANAVERTVTQKLSDFVNVKDFGATGDGVTDDYQALQNAIDSFGSDGGTLYFPVGDYNTSYPLILPPIGAIKFQGAGRNESRILKQNTTPASGTTARAIPNGGGATETFDVDAALICDHGDNSYYYGLVIKDMTIASNSSSTGAAVYAPRLAQSYFEQCIFANGSRVFWTKDNWNTRYDRCDFSSGDYGFRVEPDTSTAGTSLVFSSCYANQCQYGFYFAGTVYSTLISCAVDNTSAGGSAYYFGSNGGTECTITMIGCGTENTVGRHFIIEDSCVNIFGGEFGEADALQTLPSTYYTQSMWINGASFVTMIGTSHLPKNTADNTLTVDDTSQLMRMKTSILGGSLGSTALSDVVASTATALRFTDQYLDGLLTAGSVGTVLRSFDMSSTGYIEFSDSGTGATAQLDYYKEGSWTPACTDFTITATGCTYTRVGNQVTVQGLLAFSAYGGGSGGSAAVITGLPFAYPANTYSVGVTHNNNNSYAEVILCQSGTGSSNSQIVFYRPASGTFTALTNDEVASHNFYISYSYQVA